MKIRFVSKNQNKIKEVQSILKDVEVDLIPVNRSINEIQTEDINHLVKDKLLKAFKIVGRPVLVEHTGLYIENLNGFPGGLTQIFWDKLQADKFAILFGNGTNCNLIAKTVIGYCDSKNIFFFEGDIVGKITSEPRGNRDFQWDCIFMPHGENETFAEMCERKNELSMRKVAFDKFKDFLRNSNE